MFLLKKDELESIRLIESIKDPNIDLGWERSGLLADYLFSNNMFTALNYVIKMDCFNPNFYDCIGSTFIGSIIASTYSDNTPTYKRKIFENILTTILTLDNVDVTFTDVNDDNLLNISCSVGASNSIVERLIKIGVSPNNVNDIGFTAIGDAIRHKHFKIFDLIVEKVGYDKIEFSENDLKLIQEFKDRFNIN